MEQVPLRPGAKGLSLAQVTNKPVLSAVWFGGLPANELGGSQSNFQQPTKVNTPGLVPVAVNLGIEAKGQVDYGE